MLDVKQHPKGASYQWLDLAFNSEALFGTTLLADAKKSWSATSTWGAGSTFLSRTLYELYEGDG